MTGRPPLKDTRTKRYNVRLSEEMSIRLEALADRQGLSPTTMGAVAIGEYVSQKETQLKVTEKLISDPDFLLQVMDSNKHLLNDK